MPEMLHATSVQEGSFSCTGKYTTPWPAQSAWFCTQSNAVMLQMLNIVANCRRPCSVCNIEPMTAWPEVMALLHSGEPPTMGADIDAATTSL
jgi:hypothetical protein